MMNSNKAIAGALASAATTIVMYLFDQVAFVVSMPGAVHQSLETLVSAAIVGFVVYVTPNRPRD